jgi:hypothetical protein
MSYFESVFVKLECQRCHTIHETVVRFRSFVGRVDGEYELMEVASQGDGLPTGEVWEGNADRYCPRCLRQWAIAQAYAAYDALAELVEKRLVSAGAKGSADPLPASALSEYAERYASEFVEESSIPVTMPYFEELDLTIRDKPCHPLDLELLEDDESKALEADEIWTEFLLLIDPLMRERMKNDGWMAEETWEDFNVSLDDERRVVVEDMEGKGLTRDGARTAR